MTPFDYAIGLISIVVGLALADIAGNLQRLLRCGRAVKWDGRVLLSVTLAIVMITGMWFALWSIRGVNAVLSYPFFLSLFLEFMVLYLICAACLPDEPVANRDLTVYYEHNSRYLWTLFALFQIAAFVHAIYFASLRSSDYRSLLSTGILMAAPAILSFLLAFTRSRAFHYLAVVALLLFYVYISWQANLAA